MNAHIGKWWHRDPQSSRIVCDLCPRHCSMKEGDRGFCFVRKIENDQMVLDTYGKSTGFCIDPIEKKPLNHFYPGTSVLSFGTAGCNLGCQFCQNWDISKSREVAKLSSIAEPELIAHAAKELKCKSVAFTYNDPVIWAEYAIDTAKACRSVGVQSVAVTAGYMTPEARRDFYVHMDAANVDLKAFTEDFYRKITYSHLEPVLDTLRYLKHETDVWFEITNLVIPQTNDSKSELEQMCDWIVREVGPDVPVHFSAFHPDFRMTDRPRTPHETLLIAYDVAKQAGIRYPYVGNVHDNLHSSTYCWSCNERIIERDWYQLGSFRMLGNLCGKCGTEQSGRFASEPGDWGRKRQPVNLDSFRTIRRGVSNNHVSLPVVVPISHSPTETSTMITAPTKLPMLKFSELSEDQKQSIHKATQLALMATVCNRRLGQDWLEKLGPLSEEHVMGMFTTANRGEQLRGCCGFLGRPTPLREAILSSAQRTANEDTRMPALSVVEVPYLNVDVSLLSAPIVVDGDPKERVDKVVVGKHGLRITMGNQGGLLLPSVPVEQKWTTEQFLEGVCRKAGLPESAWKSPDTILETFEGLVIEGKMDAENVPSDIKPKTGPGSIESLQRLAQTASQNLIALSRGSTPSYYALDAMDGNVNGLVLTIVDTSTRKALAHWIRTSIRNGFALQASLFELVKSASQILSQARFEKETDIELAVTVLFDSAHHGTIKHDDWNGNGLNTPLKHCQLEGFKPEHRAIVTACGDFAAVAFDASKSVEQLLFDASSAIRTRRNPIGVYSMACMSTTASLLATNASPALDEDAVRQPAVAEAFYPADPAMRVKLVEELKGGIRSPLDKKPALALMTPHAGLRFSGQIALLTWGSVELPSSLLILGPKHTANGRDWAVSPSKAWQLPGGEEWETDLELAKLLVDRVEGMELDVAAHAREHGVEVQLPILEAFTSKADRPKICAVAIKGASMDEILRCADELAGALRTLPSLPLLVISSDMNHYAPDAENRRRDRIALDAMKSGDPKKLIEACQSNSISMCGLVPAAIVMQTLINLGKEFTVEEIAYDTSGSRGNPERVVGYAGVVLRPQL